MTSNRNRRDFLLALGTGAAALAIDPSGAIVFSPDGKLKPISGSWFEFQHHATVEGVDRNPACARFTAEQWDAKIKEAADIGMDNLVLMATALYYRAFFDTKIFAKWQLACANPLEAVLSAADKYNVKFFTGVGFYGDWQSDKTISDPVATKRRLQAIEEPPISTSIIRVSMGGIGQTKQKSTYTLRRSSSTTSTVVRVWYAS